MADDILKNIPLPADLPENWTSGQTIAPTGAEVGLDNQYGYNYLMMQVNNAQRALKALAAQREEDLARIKFWASPDPTSPAALFGGTWERIEGRFIMGASSAYPVGTTGGSATHTQTVAEMPSHNHSGSTGSAGSHSHTGSSGSAGGHSHSGSTAGAGGHNHTVSSASVTKYGISTLIGEGSTEYGFQSNSSAPVTSWVGDHTHTFSTNSTGSHTHTVSIGDSGAHTHTVSIGSTGSGQAMSVLNPYYALYLWRRVA